MNTQTRTQKVLDNRGHVQSGAVLTDFTERRLLRRDPAYVEGIYFYNGKIYEPVNKDFVEAMLREAYSGLTDGQMKSVLRWVMNSIPSFSDKDVYEAEDYIAFRNGVYNVRTKTLMPFSPDLFVRNLINWDYNPDAKSEKVDQMVDDYGNEDEKQRTYIPYLFAHCMIANRFGDAGFAIVGAPMTGKSTFVGLIEKLLGHDNVSYAEIKDGNHGKRAYGELYCKLANICEAKPGYGGTNIVHNVIVGNDIYFPENYRMFLPHPYSTIVYITDKEPNCRKIHTLHFTKQFDGTSNLEFDENDMSALINLALATYYKVGTYLY